MQTETEIGIGLTPTAKRLIEGLQRRPESSPSQTLNSPSLSSEETSGRMIRSGLPLRHREAKPEVLDRTGPWAVAYEGALAVVNQGGMACVLGQRGTGKTQLATELARAFIAGRAGKDEDNPVLYVRAMELFAALRGAFRKGSDQTEMDVLAKFRKVPLLVIDEIQERGETEFEDRTLVLLLDQRYGDMRPTLILSNLARAELAASLGKSVVSRIQEVGTVIECNWKSYRTAKAEKGGA
jgi:DNA replication protein DnaC